MAQICISYHVILYFGMTGTQLLDENAQLWIVTLDIQIAFSSDLSLANFPTGAPLHFVKGLLNIDDQINQL